MRFLEKVKQFATGKTELERKQEAAAMKDIRAEARAAALRERRTQAVRLATEREKAKYEQEIKKLRQPKKTWSSNMSYGSQFGQPRFQKQTQSKPQKRTIYVKKGKHYIKKTIKSKVPQIQKPKQAQEFLDIIGFKGLKQKGFDVMGV